MAEVFLGAFTEDWERRKATLLHDRELGRHRGGEEDEEIHRAFGGGSGGLHLGGRLRAGAAEALGGRGRTAQNCGAAAAGRPMRTRFSAVAGGSQPAVVKMASYGASSSVGAMINYVSRAGEIGVETESGDRLTGRDELTGLRGEWDHLMQNRAESRDIGAFRVTIANDSSSLDEEKLHRLVRETLESSFGDRRFAYGVDPLGDGTIGVAGVVVLRDGKGERLTGDVKAAEIIQVRHDASPAAESAKATFAFNDYGNGVEYGTSQLRRLVERFDGDVHDERGNLIDDDQKAGDLVQKEWRHELHSRKSRDVMHLILSARAGTDPAAFHEASRDFLATQFGVNGYRYIFAVHDPADDPKEASAGGKRPHIHAHAVITMRSEFGDRIETSPTVFRQWREVMAEKARAHGIAMEMTDRRETASPAAYTRNQVRPIDRTGRTEHVGTSEPAQQRYDAKRQDVRSSARAARSRAYTEKAKETWHELAKASGDRAVVQHAIAQWDHIDRTISLNDEREDGSTAGSDLGFKDSANMITLRELVSEGRDLAEMTRGEFEAYEKKVETALFRFERDVGPGERQEFDEIAGAVRDVVNARREIVDLLEEKQASIDHERAGRSGNTVAEVEERGASVAHHGDEVVEEARDVLVEIERTRAALSEIEAGERTGDARALRAELEMELTRVGEIARSGNTYMQEIAESDAEIRRAADRLEKPARSATDGKHDPAGGDDSGPNAVSVRGGSEARQDDPQASTDREAQELAERAEREHRDDQANRDRRRSDPTRQQVPRLDELEREQEQKRDRDDFER